MSELGRMFAAGWKALVTGELPREQPLTDGHVVDCPTCHGAGELAMGDGVFMACPNPKHKEPKR